MDNINETHVAEMLAKNMNNILESIYDEVLITDSTGIVLKVSEDFEETYGLSLIHILIDVLLYPGWAVFTTSVICCCGLVISGALFITDFDRQKKNMFPMLLLVAFSMIWAAVGICSSIGESRASFILMEVLSVMVLLMFVITLGRGFVRELRCRFHVR